MSKKSSFRLSNAFRYTLIFAAVGLVTLALMIYVQRSILNTYDRNLPYINLGDHIKNRTTKAHLWFEELLAGDQSIKFDQDVLAQLKISQQILQGAYDGSATEIGTFEKTNDEET